MRVILVGALALMASGCGGQVGAAKEVVSRELKDPASAEFRDVKVAGPAVCGQVNAKNSYGGYEGFRRFVVVNGVAWIDREQTMPAQPTEADVLIARRRVEFWDVWETHCGASKS